jgi:F0F1-type ATP synthase membrane subunit b/b'
MATITFDTLKFANTLKTAGVPPQQAEAQAAAFAEVIQVNLKEVATKDDLASTASELKREIADLGKDLKQEIADLRKDLKQENADLRKDAKQEIADLRKDLKQENADLRKDAKQENVDLRKDAKQEMSALEQRMNGRIDVHAARFQGELALLRWMCGIGLTISIAILGILIRMMMVRGSI